MEKSFSYKFILLFLLVGVILFSGCSIGLQYLTNRNNLVRIPQILVDIEPLFKQNFVEIKGKLILTNPSKSNLKLEKIYLFIKDAQGVQLKKLELDWQKPETPTDVSMICPIDIKLDLAVLNNDELSVFLKTDIIYKKLKLKIPYDNKVATLHLKSMKQSLKGPMIATIFSALKPGLLGNISVDYVIEFVNTFEIDLLLDGDIRLYFDKEKIIGSSAIRNVILNSGQPTLIEDTIKIEENLRKIIFDEFVKKSSQLKIDFCGFLKVAKTGISIPINIKSIQSVDFSLFSKKTKME
ncbi:MAG: hypothetical protein P9L96_04385 [Candidatus Gygaella obscura]|nr:hypothetical protein [Candidatus Gygaella obscura]